jgi:hypothetical protein
MAYYLVYSPMPYSKRELSRELNSLKEGGCSGIFISIKAESLKNRETQKRTNGILKNLIGQAKVAGLKTGVMLECFHESGYYLSENCTPPVNYLGASYVPSAGYYPICPNNPQAMQLCLSSIEQVTHKFDLDYLYLQHFRFPFFWEKEELDIQNRIPPFCYCPFCVTEFSSVMGEIVSSGEQMLNMMPEWLEWRSEVIQSLLSGIIAKVPSRVQVIVALPPLSLIDLPFTTGQLPQGFIEDGCYLSPQLHHKIKQKDLIWAEDLLDQYQLELRANKIFPSFEFDSKIEFDYLTGIAERFAGILLNHRVIKKDNLFS